VVALVVLIVTLEVPVEVQQVLQRQLLEMVELNLLVVLQLQMEQRVILCLAVLDSMVEVVEVQDFLVEAVASVAVAAQHVYALLQELL